ncbi:hypothetical protein AB0M87_19355 [Streptomyces sp. NPDC051320]
MSDLSGRQGLSEYHFFSDPVRLTGAYIKSYDREPDQAKLRSFLERV